MLTVPRLFCALAISAVPALAQPANDLCSAPEAISGATTVAFDTAGATTDGPANAACNFFNNNQIFNDVWFCWTAGAGGPTRVALCGSTTLDTKLAIYAACACPTANPLACIDDSCALQSDAIFTAAAGGTYLIRVGSFAAAATGAGMVSIGPPPPPTTIAGPINNPANGHDYFLLTASTWTTADVNAVTLGGHLATINDAAENEFVRAMVAGFDGVDRRVWIGFNDVASEGTFVWTSGEANSFTNWNGGEPNNSGGAEDYAELFGSNGAWNDNTNAPSFQVFGVVEIEAGCVADVDDGTGTGTPDGGVTIDDLLYYLALFEMGSIDADVDDGSGTGTRDGGVTIDDLLYYLFRFEEGC